MANDNKPILVPSSDKSLIPALFFKTFQALGLFPYATEWLPANTPKSGISKQSINIYLFIWSVIIWLALTFTSFVFADDYIRFYGSQLSRLEFFTAVCSVFRLSVFLHAPFTALYIIYQSRYIPPLLTEFYETLSGIFLVSGRKLSGFLWNVSFIALGWSVICAVISGVAIYSTAVTSLPYFSWSSLDSCIFGLVIMPTYAVLPWFVILHLIVVFYEVAPQMLAVIWILTIAVGFRQVASGLHGVREMSPSERANRFIMMRCSYLRLQLLLKRTNDIFSLVLLMGCLRDIITLVAFTANLLRIQDQEENETTESFKKRVVEDNSFLIYIYLFAVIAVVNTGIRTGVSIYCHEKAGDIHGTLLEICAGSVDEDFLKSCRNLKDDIGDYEKNVISAGLFIITKEYVTTIIGLLLTYFLLIYQTRDSKLAMQGFLKEKKLKEVFSILLDCSWALNVPKRLIMTHASTPVKELEIKLQWGTIAAQEWKNAEWKKQVFMLHGWQDNSNTFKTLAPLLPQDWWMVAIDLPGHGFSSHRPDGLPYHWLDYIVDVKAVLAFLGWTNYSMIAHSMGAGIGLAVAACFPDEVQSMVCIDMIKPISGKADASLQTLRRGVVAHLAGYDPAKDRTYTREEAADRWFEATATLTKDSVAVLLERGLQEVEPEQFKYTRDRRVQLPSLFRFTTEQHVDIMKAIKCDLMIIKARNTPQFEQPEIEEQFLQMYAKNCKRFVFTKAEGTHHLHLNSPKTVSDLIIDFLQHVPDTSKDQKPQQTTSEDKQENLKINLNDYKEMGKKS